MDIKSLWAAPKKLVVAIILGFTGGLLLIASGLHGLARFMWGSTASIYDVGVAVTAVVCAAVFWRRMGRRRKILAAADPKV